MKTALIVIAMAIALAFAAAPTSSVQASACDRNPELCKP
jgi:hypothetical protein